MSFAMYHRFRKT